MSEPCELLVTEGPAKGKRYMPVEAGLKLGRSSNCDIAIPDPSLSRNHCLFELRDGAIWVTDLASANGTLVNGEEITERELKRGDRVTIGDSVVEVVAVGGEAAPIVPAAASEPVPTGVVDLGFAKPGEPSTEGKAKSKNMTRTVLWGLCGLIVLVAAAVLLLQPTSREEQGLAPLAPVAGPANARLISLNYEKVEASSDGVFRYAMTVGRKKLESGMKTVLTVTVDDVLTDNRHLEKDVELSPDKLEQLAKLVKLSNVASLEPEYNGIAGKANELKCVRVKVVQSDRIFETSAENTTPPDELKNLCAQLEAFSKNELGIWAIQYSSDKLVEMAAEAMKSADAKWEERDVQYGNIAAAIKLYREAVVDLETVNPKPDYHSELVEKLAAAKEELDTRYRDQSFQCDRSIRLNDWQQAQTELKILCEMVPDEQDSRHADAAAKLLDVEGRMKKH